MAGKIGKATNRSPDVVENYTRDESNAQWGNINGEIVSFDAATQTATVKPLYRPKHDGEFVDMPDLLEVPIRFPRAGGGAGTSPIRPGDKVRLAPMMRSSENYHSGNADEAGAWQRSNHVSDMEAFLDGGESLNDPIKNFDPDNTHIRFDDDGLYGIRGSQDGKFKIEGSQGNVYLLIQEAVDLCGDGFEKLALEPTLTYTSEYASIETQLKTIAAKLQAMAL